MTSELLDPQERLFLLYDICDTKEELQEHIRTFLSIDLPNSQVDQDSTSNAMDFVWNVYDTMRTGKGQTRHVVAASRNSAKTLSACILRFYSMIHFRRSGTHLAATLDQSQSATKYLSKFIGIPGIAEYIVTSNTRNIVLVNLPPNRYTSLNNCELRIAVATTKGVNSQRGSFNTKDELDLLSFAVISEASYIANPTQDEHKFDPIEILLSSRKSTDGPIQNLIDEAEGKNPPSDLKLHKWSMVDWLKKCEPETHKPEFGTFPAWINMENLAVTWDADKYESISSAEKALNIEVLAYEGCKTCPIFMVCQGRSVNQTSKTEMLRSISFTSSVLRSVKDPESIIAQAMNLKSDGSSKVFKMFKRRMHFLPYNQMYKFITNYDPINDIKNTDEIYQALISNGWVINYGVDWGFSPASATCLVGAFHRKSQKACVIYVESAREFANQDWAKYIVENIWRRFPGDLVCPDMADVASPTYFGKFKIPCRNKKPMKIETGVSQLRGLLFDASTQRTRFAILDDGEYGQNQLLYEAFEKWTHLKTAMGFNFNKFEDNDYCDFLDPCRYLLDPFITETKISFSTKQGLPEIHDIPMAAALGNIEAQKYIEDKQKFETQFRDLLINEHGITADVFKKPELKKEKSPTGGIKFKF